MSKEKISIKYQKGITLIALVITIIVLLILATVAINMAINSDGLFGKAKEAAEGWNSAAEEEGTAIGELMNVLNNRDSENGGNSEEPGEEGGTDNPETTEEPLEITTVTKTMTSLTVKATGGNKGTVNYQYSIDNGTTWSEASNENYQITGLEEGTECTVMVKAVDTAGNAIGDTLTEQITTTAYTGNIGKYVHYDINLGIDGDFDGSTTDADDDWRVFYEENGITYLIAASYVPNSFIPNVNGNPIMNKVGPSTYIMNWFPSYTKNGSADITQAVATKYKLSWWNNNKTNTTYSAKAVASLLDESAWRTTMIPSSYGADYFSAIGAPTLEMWVDSWNARGYMEMVENSDTYGYYFENGVFNGQVWDVNSKKSKGYNNTLYFPYKTNIADSTLSIGGYWLASPAKNSTNTNYLSVVQSPGTVYNTTYDNTYWGVRPIVAVSSSLVGNDSTSGMPVYFTGQ